jgi:hypothetical protein
MTEEEYTDEQRAIIVRARARLAYIDTLVEPQRSLAIAGVPESEWADRIRWINEAVRLIKKDRTT